MEEQLETEARHIKEVEIIVNGTSYGKLPFPESIIMRKLMEEALKETKNTGRPLDDWEMKNTEGQLIDLEKHLRDYPSLDKVFITLKAGIGGSDAISFID